MIKVNPLHVDPGSPAHSYPGSGSGLIDQDKGYIGD